ncbi:DUF3822 family protein [Maribellus mangrovi]|uniref:DUF3822 family protein n=1 Tax=Maribellus mangrovi TaxID=3133146 RepID=UPI0030ED1860
MYDFVDDSFNNENSHENILSIQVSLNGFSFCIQDTNNQRILFFKHIDLKISSPQLILRRFTEWINDEEALRWSYRQKKLIYIGPQFTLLPQQFESEPVKHDLKKLLFTGNEEEFAENWIEEIHSKLFFSLPTGLNSTIQEQLGHVRIAHPITPIIRAHFRHPAETSLVLFFDNTNMYLTLKQKGQLVIANKFNVNHTNDAVYYALSVAKQLKTDAKSCAVLLVGRSAYLKGLNEHLQQHFAELGWLPSEKSMANVEDRELSEFICLY